MVLCATNGEGCNVILCSLRGELKNASLSCCKFSGTVVDTTQIISNENFTYGMYNMTKSRSYITVDIRSIFDDLNSKNMETLRSLMSEGIVNGEVRPLTRVTFDHDEAVRAFRVLAASHHCGRVLLRAANSISPTFSRPNSAKTARHVVISSANPLGVQAVDKLIASGVNKLHFHVNGTVPAHIAYKQRLWTHQNVSVTLSHGTLNEAKDVTNLLTKVSESGTIEGLHIVADKTCLESLIQTIDVESRSLCPLLKYFIILTNNDSTGYNICLKRTNNKLPATLLDISRLRTYQDTDGNVWYRGVGEAVDLMSQSEDPVLLAMPEEKHTPRMSLVQQLASLTGLYIDSNTPTTDSLEQLGLSGERISSVCAFLRDEYNTSLLEHDIPYLTIERLQEIEERTNDVQFKETNGLNKFYSSVEPDELRATTDMVFLPTLSHNNSMRDDEFDMNEAYLIIVPGLEGMHARFHTICERLKLPAIVLQPGFDHYEGSPRELALRYFKILQKKVALKNKFYILGYETGVAVGLELTTLLENKGFTGTLFALGDGPSETQVILKSTLDEFPTEVGLQEALIYHMFKLMGHTTDTDKLESILQKSSSWNERKTDCVRLLLGHVPHSAQYTQSLLEASLTRMEAARRHYICLEKPVRSQIVLLRARTNSELTSTCSLENYSQQKLIVHDINTPLEHITKDLRVSAIINSYLDKEVLQAFENKNLCDAHLMNADAFITLS